jgi:HEAT repeat protein/CheY-like chemotaxis protein
VDLSQYGPAVRAVLETERTTSEELLEGILLLVELGEPELARPLLDRLLQTPPDAATLADLARDFGSHRLLRLATTDTLGQPARDFATAAIEAYAAEVRDPQRLNQLIAQLNDPRAEVRFAAVAGLLQAPQPAAVALVSALDDAQGESHRNWLQVALAELAPASYGPLLAGLDAEAATTRAQAATLLGRTAPAYLVDRLLSPAVADTDPQVRSAASEATGRMIGRVPSPEAVERMLEESIENHLSGNLPLATDENGLVEVWHWDPVQQVPVATRLEPTQAHVHLAAQLAEDLVQLAPRDMAHLKQALMLRLATGQADWPPQDWPVSLDDGVLEELALQSLHEALEQNLPRAAAGAAQLLGETATPSSTDLLVRRAPAESPLVRALDHPSRSVRWAALSAIMRIDQGHPYPGASRVLRTLMDFIRAGARPRAVIALPLLEKAQTLGATVDRLGYEVTLATTGRQAILAAADQGGADLVLVDARISHPTLREVLYQIRAYPSSAGAAVGVLGIGKGLDWARQVAEDHPRVEAFPHPLELSGDTATEDTPIPPTEALADDPTPPRIILDEQAVSAIIERLHSTDQAFAAEDLPSRIEMARQAMMWLSELVARPDNFYDVRQYESVILQATNEPELAESGIAILAQLGSHESQHRLVDMASTYGLPIELREMAAEAFRASVQRYGVQLTASEILAQYDRYNASETADRPTQAVLGHVLDTIEGERPQDQRVNGLTGVGQ